MPGISSNNNSAPAPPPGHRQHMSPLVIISAFLVLLGAGGSLLTRVYFVQGGQSLWLCTMMQVSGWPLLLPPICISLLLRRRSSRSIAGADDLLLPPRLVGAVAVLGAFFTVACYAYSLGSQALPLTTTSPLQATQLAFTALSAFVFAGVRFTPFSANAVVLLTVGPAVLGVGPSSSSSSVTEKQLVSGQGSRTTAAYWAGFSECMASAALMGLVVPLFEVAMSRYGRRTTGPGGGGGGGAFFTGAPPSYVTVMQVQAVIGAAGTVLCLVGMAVMKEFQAMPREAATFGLGETNYCLVLIFGTVSWQLCNLGVMGLIACSSSLLAGIMIALLVPLSEVLAVIFLHEKFDGVKGVVLVLCLWGFVSYLYGESAHKEVMTKTNEDPESICCPLITNSTCNNLLIRPIVSVADKSTDGVLLREKCIL